MERLIKWPNNSGIQYNSTTIVLSFKTQRISLSGIQAEDEAKEPYKLG